MGNRVQRPNSLDENNLQGH